MNDDTTIFAVASGAGRAAVAILRISGPATAAILQSLTGRPPPPPRLASLRLLQDSRAILLDKALVLWMPAPASYTGEDCAELHVHAGPAIIDGVGTALLALGARPAEAGAFTRRAFLNGRLDLTQAEAVADLVAAETEGQRDQALRQLGGALGAVFDSWAKRLRALLAQQEAMIDFPDETHEADQDEALACTLIAEITAHLTHSAGGERLRTGLHLAITGPPNVGKSSLLNALAGREAAIVSPHAGTTRDVIEVRAVFGGVPVVLLDTAGLRATDEPVEAEGVRRARTAAKQADAVIAVEQANAVCPCWPFPPADVRVSSKVDLGSAWPDTIGVSVLSGEGLAALRSRLDQLAAALTQASGPPPLTRLRHRAACSDALTHIRAAVAEAKAELRAEEFRLAMRALGRVTGAVQVEDVLDDVFSQFCIGK